MAIAKLLAAVLIASFIHAFVLRVATKMMVEVSIRYGHAYKIVAAEYIAASVTLAALMLINIAPGTAAYVISGVVLLFVGALCVGRWLFFDNGSHIGVGNGVLIQFMQIPLVIPFAILASFLFNAS